jgi:hypothetical protein
VITRETSPAQRARPDGTRVYVWEGGLSHLSCGCLTPVVLDRARAQGRERESGVELPLDGVVEDDLTQHHSQQQIFPVASHDLLEASQESRLVL